MYNTTRSSCMNYGNVLIFYDLWKVDFFGGEENYFGKTLTASWEDVEEYVRSSEYKTENQY